MPVAGGCAGHPHTFPILIHDGLVAGRGLGHPASYKETAWPVGLELKPGSDTKACVLKCLPHPPF